MHQAAKATLAMGNDAMKLPLNLNFQPSYITYHCDKRLFLHDVFRSAQVANAQLRVGFCDLNYESRKL